MPARGSRARPSTLPNTACVSPPGTVSLARALSKLGVCSRSQAEQAVRDGRVRVNGHRVTDSSLRVVPERDVILLDGARAAAPTRTYLMLNKPRGLVTTRRDPQGRATVYDCLSDASLPFLAPVGRLDQASEGLLLFTNDTQWANAITAPSSHVPKTYHVQIDRLPDASLIDRLRQGVATDSSECLHTLRVELLRAGTKHGWLLIELDEGRNRHIRRMLELLGVAVLRLVRVAIGGLQLGALPKGEYRALTGPEVAVLAAPSRRSTVASRRDAAPSVE